jgi:hypothetical protein
MGKVNLLTTCLAAETTPKQGSPEIITVRRLKNTSIRGEPP